MSGKRRSKSNGNGKPHESREARYKIDKDGVPHAIVSTLREVADCFQVSTSTVYGHWRGEMPVRKDGRFDLKKIHYWKLGRKRDPTRLKKVRGEETAEKTGDDTLRAIHHQRAEAEAREKLAKALRAERENRLAEENIVDQRDVNRAFAMWFGWIRDTFQSVPEEFEPELDERRRADQTEFLRGIIDRKLIALRDRGIALLSVSGEGCG